MWTSQFQVIVALILRNMRTRFFGHGLGFLIAVGWPLAHILLLLVIHASFNRAAPFGESLVIFFATGLVPFMCFSYMSRFLMLSVLQNRSLLAFPAVKVTDLLFAGAILEALSSCCVVIVLIAILIVFDIDFVPADPVQAAYAFGATILLGFGFGVINAVIAMAVPTWFTGYTLVTVLLYMISGIFFVPDALPDAVRGILAWNPTLQTVEWMRSAYYEGYGRSLDKAYVLGCGVLSLFCGLVAERIFRGKLLILK